MGVYIAGMKMPKDCGECLCADNYYCNVLERDVYDKETFATENETRPADCPMKEVAIVVGGRKIYEDNN